MHLGHSANAHTTQGTRTVTSSEAVQREFCSVSPRSQGGSSKFGSPWGIARARKYRIPYQLLNRSYKPRPPTLHASPGMHAGPPFGCSETWPSLPNRTALTADATP